MQVVNKDRISGLGQPEFGINTRPDCEEDKNKFPTVNTRLRRRGSKFLIARKRKSD
jgi:hypothetical protein